MKAQYDSGGVRNVAVIFENKNLQPVEPSVHEMVEICMARYSRKAAQL